MRPPVFDASVIVDIVAGEIDVVDLEQHVDLRVLPPTGLIASVNWCEVLYVVRRSMGVLAEARFAYLIGEGGLSIVATDADLASYAADVKQRFGLSLGDCFAAGLAFATDSPLITVDKDFLPLREHGLQVAWLGDPALQ